MSFRGTISTRLVQLDAVRCLGPRWLGLRLHLEASRRIGRPRRATPKADWQDLPSRLLTTDELVNPEALADWLAENVSESELVDLKRSHEELQDRRFQVFGETATVSDWHTDPLTGGRYASSVHWSEVREIPGSDLKCIWEPARFGWAFNLARLHLIDPSSDAATTFWELLEGWMDANPPNVGVHWYCGQEASVRLLAVTLAAQAMRSEFTDDRRARLASLAHATADRVVEYVGYARSQRNNHLSSEAMGLTLAAFLLPTAPAAKRWLHIANEAWDEVATKLVFADGGTSQYSSNYHRVFVEALLVRELVALRSGTSTASRSALERAHDVLEVVMVPSSGQMPAFGHDDGARIMPVDRLPHRDIRGTVQLGRAVLGRSALGPGMADESIAWFGLEAQLPLPKAAAPAIFDTRPDFGLHRIAIDDTFVFIRAGVHRHRPAHADQLNVDVWFGQRNVVLDRGTATYAGEAARNFTASEHHSTIVFDDHDHMPRASRFLFAHWVHGRLVSVRHSNDVAEVVVEARIRRSWLRRSVRVTRGCVEVEDRVIGGERRWATVWQLAHDMVHTVEPRLGDEHQVGQLRATSYGQTAPDVTTLTRRPVDGVVRTRIAQCR